MQDIRQIILDRMQDAGWSKYKLAEHVKDHMSQANTYRFLAGQGDITTEKLAYILEALGLEIRPKGDCAGRNEPQPSPTATPDRRLGLRR
jgi:hypothetical protein